MEPLQGVYARCGITKNITVVFYITVNIFLLNFIGRRGYPCGLWSLFHTLTVVCLEKNQQFPVLDAIHGYVKEFFGCKECSGHFTKMVADDGALMITPIKDQVVWLWRAHNKVNQRSVKMMIIPHNCLLLICMQSN